MREQTGLNLALGLSVQSVDSSWTSGFPLNFLRE